MSKLKDWLFSQGTKNKRKWRELIKVSSWKAKDFKTAMPNHSTWIRMVKIPKTAITTYWEDGENQELIDEFLIHWWITDWRIHWWIRIHHQLIHLWWEFKIVQAFWKTGKGNGNPLQYSCLENFMDRGAWWVTVHGVTKGWTWLND